MGFGTAVVVSSGADFVVRAAGVAAARGPEWAAEPCRGIRAVHVVGAARLAAAPAPPRAAHVAVAAVFALVAAQVLVPVAALLTRVAGARTAADGARGLALSVAADPVVARLTPITSAAPTMFVVELRVSARSATLDLAVPAPLLSAFAGGPVQGASSPCRRGRTGRGTSRYRPGTTRMPPPPSSPAGAIGARRPVARRLRPGRRPRTAPPHRSAGRRSSCWRRTGSCRYRRRTGRGRRCTLVARAAVLTAAGRAGGARAPAAVGTASRPTRQQRALPQQISCENSSGRSSSNLPPHCRSR